MLDERCVQTVSMPFNIFKNKGNVEVMLNESLNQFELIQHTFNKLSAFFYTFNNVGRPVQTPPTFGSTTVLNAFLKQMLKQFKWAFTDKILYGVIYLDLAVKVILFLLFFCIIILFHDPDHVP